ncbi:MAG: SDR family NAD(P)-dependent oxidoreductase [Acidimicrobiia bacterium]
MPRRFAGRVALITGGATGLGRAFADALIDDGAVVALADIDAGAAEEAAAQLDGRDAVASAVACDVADERSVQRAVDEVVERHGGVDILVNNAARHLKKYNQPFSTLTNDEIRGLFDVNVMGIIHCSLACRSSMADRGGGAIVNISSAAGYVATTPYGVTKLAVRGLTIAFATELADDRIRVNAVAPTVTPTESVLAEYSAAELERSVATRQLVRRTATADDVARTVLFLCSDEAGFITGETIRVTGGAALSI